MSTCQIIKSTCKIFMVTCQIIMLTSLSDKLTVEVRNKLTSWQDTNIIGKTKLSDKSTKLCGKLTYSFNTLTFVDVCHHTKVSQIK